MRARALLDEWILLVIVALLALSVVGGWGVYTSLTTDQTATEVDASDPSWSTTGGFEHAAVVTEPNEVFDVGTELSNRSTYFMAVSPELEGEFQYRYEAASGDVDVDVELEQIHRSVDSENEVEHWAVTETLDTETDDSVSPGTQQMASFRVDVPAAVNETEQAEASLGASPGTTETVLFATVTMTGTVNGDFVERTDTYELEIDPDEEVYHVDGPTNERWTSDHNVSDASAEPTSTSGLGLGSSALLVFVSLGALCLLISAKRRDILAPSPTVRTKRRRRVERERFDEWISRGSLPDELRNRSQIEVQSLPDLVDVAIDCNRRVLEETDSYYVVDGDLLYRYEPARSMTDENRPSDADAPESDESESEPTDGRTSK